MASSLIARQFVFERVSFPTSFKSGSVNWPTNCIFVVVLTDALRPMSCAKASYTQGEQTSSAERLGLANTHRTCEILVRQMSGYPTIRPDEIKSSKHVHFPELSWVVPRQE